MAGETWWGNQDLDIGQWTTWQIGPASVGIQRLEREWRVAWTSSSDPLAMGMQVGVPTLDPPAWEPKEEHRFAQASTEPQFRILPALPDRSVVSRPDKSFLVLPGEEVIAYVSAPLWMNIQVGNRHRPLMDVPLFRPSAMWFGPPTEEGEHCYAMRTRLLLHRSYIQHRPHRAITAARLHNTASSPLTVTHLRIPVSNLPLFVSGGGHLWTASISVQWSGDGDMANVSVEAGPPDGLGTGEKLVSARQSTSSNLLLRSFSSVIGAL